MLFYEQEPEISLRKFYFSILCWNPVASEAPEEFQVAKPAHLPEVSGQCNCNCKMKRVNHSENKQGATPVTQS